jgi:hypothetical protein
VVDFIIRHYGKQKLADLLQSFKQGMYFDDVFTKVLGVDTDGLENEWRKDIGAPQRVIPTRTNASPTPFPTFGLSTDLGSGSSSSAASAAATGAPAAATSTPGSVAANATPLAAATNAPPVNPQSQPPSSSTNPIQNLCGGAFGLIGLGIFGATLQYRKRGKRL